MITATDYFPFGFEMPGRRYGTLPRYTFNGKEQDPESGYQDYGFRIYDRRIGRFLSEDPLTKEYPELTPYQFAGNTPIWATDLDGLEPNYTSPQQVLYEYGAGVSQALGNAWDRFTGLFSSNKTEIDRPVNNSGTSIVTTRETTVRAGGNMESWIMAGRYSTNNTMPKLKLSNFFSIETKTDSKVEVKQTTQAGNVKWENKVNVDGSSVETKVTVQNVKLGRTPVPVDLSASKNINSNGSKSKFEVKTSTKPLNVGGAVEIVKDKKGNVTGGTVGATFQVEKKTKDGTTIKNTTTVGKTF